jgi:hypothetical protein
MGVLEDPQIDLDQFSITAGERTINLSNVYQVFLSLGRRDRRDFVSQAVLASVVEQDLGDWSEVAESLLPNTRSPGFLRYAMIGENAPSVAFKATEKVAGQSSPMICFARNGAKWLSEAMGAISDCSFSHAC